MTGEIERTWQAVRNGMATTGEVRFWYGIGLGQQLLGRLDLTCGNYVEAQRHLNAQTSNGGETEAAAKGQSMSGHQG
jgi:hypothetical protein